MADPTAAPAPSGKDDIPEFAITVVTKVKSKLGYTEIHTPAADPDKVRIPYLMCLQDD